MNALALVHMDLWGGQNHEVLHCEVAFVGDWPLRPRLVCTAVFGRLPRFAYGQTGAGKSHTMRLGQPERYRFVVEGTQKDKRSDPFPVWKASE